mmetsp:Transcript_11628/g.40706  ORF Transcript_11628/g.40706 Transcript_11628/m.40706 type:complete len:232 (-) Transcript_11628:248-943(-)
MRGARRQPVHGHGGEQRDVQHWRLAVRGAVGARQAALPRLRPPRVGAHRHVVAEPGHARHAVPRVPERARAAVAARGGARGGRLHGHHARRAAAAAAALRRRAPPRRRGLRAPLRAGRREGRGGGRRAAGRRRPLPLPRRRRDDDARRARPAVPAAARGGRAVRRRLDLHGRAEQDGRVRQHGGPGDQAGAGHRGQGRRRRAADAGADGGPVWRAARAVGARAVVPVRGGL